MIIELLTAEQLTKEIQQQAAELYRQLNATNKQRPLSEVLEASNKVLVAICKIDESLVGMALLSTYKVISGYRGLVEDVIVDTSQRGKGIGRKLMEKLLDEGKNLGLNEILLFTGHHRKPAITLYGNLGFIKKDSGIYHLKFT